MPISEKQLRSYLQQIHKAWMRKNRARLMEYFHPESYSEFGGFGPYRIWGKRELEDHLDDYLNGDREVVYYRIREPRFQLHVKTAVITYHFEMGTREGGGPLQEVTGKETHVVEQSTGGLRVIHIHWSLNS